MDLYENDQWHSWYDWRSSVDSGVNVIIIQQLVVELSHKDVSSLNRNIQNVMNAKFHIILFFMMLVTCSIILCSGASDYFACFKQIELFWIYSKNLIACINL